MPLLAITSSLHATADGLNDDDKVPTAQGGARWYAVRGILSRSA
jgi:hypothetical protein